MHFAIDIFMSPHIPNRLPKFLKPKHVLSEKKKNKAGLDLHSHNIYNLTLKLGDLTKIQANFP